MNDDFQPDNAGNSEEENLTLRDLLMGVWRDKYIEKIERQRNPDPVGWYALFRGDT